MTPRTQETQKYVDQLKSKDFNLDTFITTINNTEILETVAIQAIKTNKEEIKKNEVFSYNFATLVSYILSLFRMRFLLDSKRKGKKSLPSWVDDYSSIVK